MNRFRPVIPSAEFLRFAAVTVLGLITDISLAFWLSKFFGINLVIAAAAGFAVGAIVNYLLHEFWTFQCADRRLSTSRMLRYCGAVGATLITRMAAVYALSQTLFADQGSLIILLLATLLSFFVNYLLSKFFVFQLALPPKSVSKGDGL